MKKYLTTIGVIVALFVIPSLALARPIVNISVKAEMEVAVKEAGKMVTKRVEAKNVEPGSAIFYTITFKNDGDEKATKAVVDNPVPKNTQYVPGSAYGENAEITFSIDNGKTYNKPSMLYYEVTEKQGQKSKRVASPDTYTNIKWVIPVIEKGQKGTVGFKAIVK